MKSIKRVFCFVIAMCMLASVATFPTFSAEMKSITDVNIEGYSKIRFKGETNKDFTQYEVGEEIVFTMTLWGDDEQLSAPYFKCTLTGDDGQSSVEYYDATSGSIEVRTSLSKAGAVRLEVEPCDSSKNVIAADNITKFEGGALAGASDIQTTVAEPLDFDAYWAGKLAELDECEPTLHSIEPIESNNPNFDAYIVKINCIGVPSMVASGETWVTGILSVPKNVTHNWLGLQLHFQGYGVNPVWQIHQNDNISFHVMAHSIEPDRNADYYWNTEALGLQNYGWSAEENADPDTSYFTYMILRDVQALRFLKKYFGEEGGASLGGVDTSAWKGMSRCHYIQVNGSSQGGFQAISVAALDSDVTHVAASIPWFADVAGNTVPTRIQSSFRPPYSEGLLYLDTAFMAKRVKAGTVWMDGGTGDTLCPMYGVQAIYNNFNTNVSFNFVQGKCHGATNTIAITSNQSKSNKESSVVSGHITESWQGSTTVDNNWEFDPETGVLTVTSNSNGGWNECGSIYSNGSWANIITYIREVILVGNMSKLSANAFKGAVNLEKVTIPAQVGQINASAFEGCEKLTTVLVAGEPEIENAVNFYNIVGSGNCLADGSNIFLGASSVNAIILGSVYSDEYPLAESNMPANLRTVYGNTDYLKRYCEEKGLEFIPFGKASEANVYWTIDEASETLTLFGSGAVNGLDSGIDAYATSVKKVIINASITALGDGALSKLTALESVSFKGDAPTVAPGAKPFGERSSDFAVKVKASAEGFEGETWCGYTLIKQTFVAGDTNDDGEVDTKDAVLLAQYLAKWNVEINLLAADTNGDGEVDTKDAVLLAQYLAKWNVELVGGSAPTPDPTPDPIPDPIPDPDDLEDNEVDADIVI